MEQHSATKSVEETAATLEQTACADEGSDEQSAALESRQPQTPPAGSPSELEQQVAELQQQLAEKERLVAALTERLEQAAEQLDRLHRTGADRALRVPGLPAELVAVQRELAERLKEAVDQWENMQAAAALGRIEMQLAELRDLIVTLTEQAPAPSAGAPLASGSSTPARGETGGAPQTPTANDLKAAAGSWEALKAQLLSGESATPEESEPAGASLTAALAAAAAGASNQQNSAADTAERSSPGDSADTEPINEVPPPEPIDPETASLEQLREAVETRDAYISYLLKKLKLAPTPQLPTDWQSLQNVPDELRKRLEELERQLNDKLRLAEVDLSLERARLARQEAALRQREAQLEQKLKQYGLQLDDPSDEDQQPAQNRRWLKFLLGRRPASDGSSSKDDSSNG